MQLYYGKVMDIDSLADKLDGDTLSNLKQYVDTLRNTNKPASEPDNRLEKLQSSLVKKEKDLQDAISKHQNLLTDLAITKACAGQEFVDTDMVSMYLRQRLIMDGDRALYKSEDGRTLPLDEAAALLAKQKPYLTKAVAHGSGYQKPAKEGVEQVVNPWAKETFNLTKQAQILKTDPQLADRLKKEAKK